MTKIKKRATALLLGTVTFFMALAMPYNTTLVYYDHRTDGSKKRLAD